MRGKRILIVEDEPILGFDLEDMLEGLGWEAVGIATRLHRALELIESAAPDAAILDVNLHNEQSYPAADMLADRRIPFIFATGYGDSQHPERHRSVPTLIKPYSQDDVRAALAQT